MKDISNVANALNDIANGLTSASIAVKSGHFDVEKMVNGLNLASESLRTLSPMIGDLLAIGDAQNDALTNIHEIAVSLLLALDDSLENHTPRTHDDKIAMVHNILDYLIGEESTPPPKPLPPEFSAAMHRYKAIADQHGQESQEAQRAFMVAMELAPDWFVDDAHQMGKDMGLIPEADSYLDDGTPLVSLESLARQMGISEEEAQAKLETFIAEREALGLPIDGCVDASKVKVHRKQ